MVMEDEINRFLGIGFESIDSSQEPEPGEREVIQKILDCVDSHITQKKRPKRYVLGLALDFTLLAQLLSKEDEEAKNFRPELTEKQLFDKYKLVTNRGETASNTLTLTCNGKEVGIRKIEERVVGFFHSLNRTGYPSAYVYNTAQWIKFKDLLVLCFKLSENGRHLLCRELIFYGFEIFPLHEFTGRKEPRVRIFQEILCNYPRQDKQENGGLAFQGIAHGFIAADRPHLSLIVDKVRTGSARQKRFGDIDCYQGLDLELSVEVKDMSINSTNVKRQLGGFINEVRASGVLGIVISLDASLEVITKLREDGIVFLTMQNIIKIVQTWDWPKQDNALQGMLHHIAHIEQNTEATNRLLAFIAQQDPSHDSLVYYSESQS